MSAERLTLLTYPFLGVPTAVSSKWDALYWIGDHYQDGLEVRDGRPEVHARDASGPHLVRANANADLVVEFDQVRAVPSRSLDIDGCAARAFAVLTDDAAVHDVTVAPHAYIPWPHVAMKGMTLALYRPLRTLFYLSADGLEPTVFAVPVLDNNMVDWSRAAFADELPELAGLNTDALQAIHSSLIAAENRRTDAGSPSLITSFDGVNHHEVMPVWPSVPTRKEELAAIAEAFVADVGFSALRALGTLDIDGYTDGLEDDARAAAKQAGELVAVIAWYQDGGKEAHEELAAMVRDVTPSAADRINRGSVITQLAHLVTTLGLEAFWARFGQLDTESSASRQHYIDTGRYLRVGEAD